MTIVEATKSFVFVGPLYEIDYYSIKVLHKIYL